MFVDLVGEAVPVGRLWARARGARETASFEYEPSWLQGRDAFSLDPALPLAGGPMRRNERRRAGAEGRKPRALLAVDFLALVDDETRLGVLRFRDAGDGSNQSRR